MSMRHPLARRPLLQWLCVAALPAPAAAGFNFFTSEYTASHAELQALVHKQFPLQQRYAELFMVRLRDPQLGLNADANRAAITATLDIASPLLRTEAVEGLVAVSGALRWDAATRALRLDKPKAERLELHGLRSDAAERLRRVGAVVAQDLLQDWPLKTFTREEMSFGRKTYDIGAITVLADGIKVQLL